MAVHLSLSATRSVFNDKMACLDPTKFTNAQERPYIVADIPPQMFLLFSYIGLGHDVVRLTSSASFIMPLPHWVGAYA